LDEARTIYSKIISLKNDNDYSLNYIAIFYRTNAQSRSFEELFLRKRLPYRIVGSVKFYERKEIKDALAYIRILINPRDNLSLLRIINTPPRGIGKAALEKISRFAEQRDIPLLAALEEYHKIEGISSLAARGIREFLLLRDSLKKDMKNCELHFFVEEVISKSGYWKMTEEMSEKDPQISLTKLGNLQELVNAVKEFEDRCEKQGVEPKISVFLDEVSLASEVDSMDNSSDAVTLMTAHLAKGLEFKVVFLTGMEEGLFPINSANSSAEEMEEERRLCYVGMTRAKRKLFLSWAKERKTFGKTYVNSISRFVFESEIDGKRADSFSSDREKYNPFQSSAQTLLGQKVSHPVYGVGRILNITGSGEYAKITVRFSNGSKQTFMLKYAPLEML